jgi:[ribosomal protein S5]-alanine N-acetyltransferase
MNNKMLIETDRLLITEFDENMIESVHLNSLDDDNRRFVPDEVFETIDEARKTVEWLISCYQGNEGPFVYTRWKKHWICTSGANREWMGNWISCF